MKEACNHTNKRPTDTYIQQPELESKAGCRPWGLRCVWRGVRGRATADVRAGAVFSSFGERRDALSLPLLLPLALAFSFSLSRALSLACRHNTKRHLHHHANLRLLVYEEVSLRRNPHRIICRRISQPIPACGHAKEGGSERQSVRASALGTKHRGERGTQRGSPEQRE